VSRSAGLVLASLALGCSDDAKPLSECGASQAIVSGAARSAYLGLAESEQAAIVRLEAAGIDGPTCSGTLIAERHVLTAKHCLEPPETSVVIEHGSDTTRANINAVIEHPDADLCVVELDQAVDLELVSPLSPAADGIDESWTGRLVEIAGYGNDEHADAGFRRFAVEAIDSVTATNLIVNGKGQSGACLGDSGGPLLVRAPDGRPLVAGVLSTGSSSCLGQDFYLRTDVVADWVLSTAGDQVSPFGCGSIDGEGKCLWGRALWCEGETLRSDACAEGTTCGWAEHAGYRCVEPASDACVGFDGLGDCEDGTARRCDRGTLVSDVCDACSAKCARRPATGVATCMPTLY
jgi:hypothetical protein